MKPSGQTVRQTFKHPIELRYMHNRIVLATFGGSTLFDRFLITRYCVKCVYVCVCVHIYFLCLCVILFTRKGYKSICLKE